MATLESSVNPSTLSMVLNVGFSANGKGLKLPTISLKGTTHSY